ncbi:MAG: AAA family ATPase [Flavisolibacter sp.]
MAEYKFLYSAKTYKLLISLIKMETLVGRQQEQKRLQKVLHSGHPELIAVYGRRRVGKTFLIRTVFAEHLVFEFTGLQQASMKDQLLNFSYALRDAMKSPVDLAVPPNWVVAFNTLKSFLEPKLGTQKVVVFFDEFPWIHTQKSNFLRAFDHFWNSCGSKHSNLKVVICGSAASWMIRNVLNNKGGLHNRVTEHIQLAPFTLKETAAYLASHHVSLNDYQLLQIYMALGGIPYYLRNIEKGESAAQVIDRLFFSKQAPMKAEFGNLYGALFDNPAHHESVIRALSKVSKGLSRNEIIELTGLSSGGTATRVLVELEQSGFISAYIPFEKTTKDALFKLTDEYSLFYLKFIDKSRATGPGTWMALNDSASFRSWSGYAFEAICFKHIAQIKAALGPISYAEESVWRYVPPKGSKQMGAQIDLLLDRKDDTINICEMKFSKEPFTITKAYANELEQKQVVFKERTRTKKNIHLTILTTYGVMENDYFRRLVQNSITMQALFE